MDENRIKALLKEFADAVTKDLAATRTRSLASLMMCAAWDLGRKKFNLTVRVVQAGTLRHMRRVSLATKQFCSNS